MLISLYSRENSYYCIAGGINIILEMMTKCSGQCSAFCLLNDLYS